jgi:creatinine amidohydrolase
MRTAAFAILLALTAVGRQNAPPPVAKSVRLESLTWQEAEPVLTPESVVVIPLGAASKEHGPHLKLRNDLALADYLTNRVADATSVVIAPTLTYHFYPAFLEYPGSTSLTLATARDMTTEVVRTLASYGPRRFYILNTGMSTVRALEPAATTLARDGVLMRYTNLSRFDAAMKRLIEQPAGSHADEVETSMMLFIDPSSVDMTKAVRDLNPSPSGSRLSRQRDQNATYSPTGTWGDPTRANRDKGRFFVDTIVNGIVDDITALRTAPLPTRSSSAQALTMESTRAEPTLTSSPAVPSPDRCSEGDERAIIGIGSAFAAAWANGDAIGLGALWSSNGDMIHPDGTNERGAQTITINRMQLFNRREYRNTRHPLQLLMVRCLSNDIAVADGKWELRGVFDSTGKPLPTMEGQATLVLKRSDKWLIEAYRYTIKPAPPGQTPPAHQGNVPAASKRLP